MIRALVASSRRVPDDRKNFVLRLQEQLVTGTAWSNVILGMHNSKRNVGSMLRIKKDSNARRRKDGTSAQQTSWGHKP